VIFTHNLLNEGILAKTIFSGKGRKRTLYVEKKLKMIKQFREGSEGVYINIRTNLWSQFTKISVFGKNTLKFCKF